MIPWFKVHPWEIPLPLFGTLKLQPFGLLAAVAIVVGARAAQRRGRQLGLNHEQVADFLTVTTVVGLMSAYVLNAVLYHPAELWAALGEPSRLWSRYWGLSSYGGFFGGFVTAVLFAWRRRTALLPLSDLWCYAIVFAWIFARMGCFVVHDHPGVASDFVLAVDNYDGLGIARHDLGLYEVLWSLVVAPLCYWLSRPSRPPRPAGYFTALVLLLYGPVRFALDFLRISAAEGGDARYLGLTPAQYFSLLITCIGAALWLRVRGGALSAGTAAAA